MQTTGPESTGAVSRHTSKETAAQLQVMSPNRLTVLDELGEERLVGEVAVVLLEELLRGRQRCPGANGSFK